MKKILFLLITWTLTFSFAAPSDAERARLTYWLPIIYEDLSPEAQKIINSLDYIDSRTALIVHQLLGGLVLRNCIFESSYKNGALALKILDSVSGQTYNLKLIPRQSLFGEIRKRDGFEYYLIVTDTTQDRGLTIKGSTYTIEVKMAARGPQSGQILEVQVLSNLKTIFSGILLGPIGEWLGRKSMEDGLDLKCISSKED